MRRAARILVGTDFSAGSRRAVERARVLARLSHASLTIAHVRPSSDVRAAVLEERGDLVRQGGRSLSRSLAEHYGRRLASTARGGKRERTIILRGAADVALTREAKRGYDLLVLGSHGRRPVATLFVGSTVQRVLARSRVPVLVVPARRSR